MKTVQKADEPTTRAASSGGAVCWFEEEHRTGTVEALLAVHAATGTYPPAQDTTGEANSLRRWLFSEPTLGRWVAVFGGEVVGHVQVTHAHHYLQRHFRDGPEVERLEVGKLFVSPTAQGHGLGDQLLATAREFAQRRGLPLALAVLPDSRAAIALYRRTGLRDAGTFHGDHGLNLVFSA